MKGLLRLAGAIDAISGFFGRIAAWLVLLSCLISAGNATSRYLFNLSSNAWLEIQWQMFAGIFLLGARQRAAPQRARPRRPALRRRARSAASSGPTCIGILLFLIPSILTMIFFSLGVLPDRFRSGEHSSNAGGLMLWPVKLAAAVRPLPAAAAGRSPS